jgi:hypothetical protein
MARMTASFQTNLLLRVRNESICYVVSIDRTKPNNSVRINPATRHPETKYGFVILAGDMIFKYFFVGVELLLRHERPSSTAENASKTKPRGGLLTVRQTAVVLSPRAVLNIPQKGRTGNAVMDANLRVAHTREKLLQWCAVGEVVGIGRGAFSGNMMVAQ